MSWHVATESPRWWSLVPALIQSMQSSICPMPPTDVVVVSDTCVDSKQAEQHLYRAPTDDNFRANHNVTVAGLHATFNLTEHVNPSKYQFFTYFNREGCGCYTQDTNCKLKRVYGGALTLTVTNSCCCF